MDRLNNLNFEVIYGDSNNQWKMSLAQSYFIYPGFYRPDKIRREIAIPPRIDCKAIEHV